MSTHYLIDLHTTPFANSEINDVRFSKTGETLLGGNFIVRLPDGISIGPVNPTDLTDLLTKKYAGLLAFYAGYTRITYDDLLDAANIDLPACVNASVGDRSTIRIPRTGTSVLQSLPTPLIGAAPVECVVTYETFDTPWTSPIDGRGTRTYTETVPGVVSTCDVSFNGGATFLSTTDGGLLNIPPADQGTSFVFRVTSTGAFGANVSLGSWAVLY